MLTLTPGVPPLVRSSLMVALLSAGTTLNAQTPLAGVLAEDRDKHPLACVELALTDASGTVRERTRTGPDGSFRFTAAPDSGALLHVSAHLLEPTDLPVAGVQADATGVRHFLMVLEPAEGGGSEATSDPADTPPLPVRGFIAPKYPDEMRAAGARGSAVVGFAVDDRGRVDEQSLITLQATNDVFLASVRQAVLGARFRPAQRGGRAACAFTLFAFQFALGRSQ